MFYFQYIIREKGMKSMAICCLHSYRRGYSVHDGAHIAIRLISNVFSYIFIRLFQFNINY